MADPDVDLVYIATPHSLHAEQAILCMKAGKNVLVEKSFTANAGQAREALAVAEETGMLCTEAIWTRYMPSRKLINEVIESGEIGEVKAASANLCYPVSGKARMTDPACAGGALLDVGVYPLNFLDMAVGADHGRTLDHFDTSMVPAETGVDAAEFHHVVLQRRHDGRVHQFDAGFLRPRRLCVGHRGLSGGHQYQQSRVHRHL